jgi:hypothetical protein
MLSLSDSTNLKDTKIMKHIIKLIMDAAQIVLGLDALLICLGIWLWAVRSLWRDHKFKIRMASRMECERCHRLTLESSDDCGQALPES